MYILSHNYSVAIFAPIILWLNISHLSGAKTTVTLSSLLAQLLAKPLETLLTLPVFTFASIFLNHVRFHPRKSMSYSIMYDVTGSELDGPLTYDVTNPILANQYRNSALFNRSPFYFNQLYFCLNLLNLFPGRLVISLGK